MVCGRILRLQALQGLQGLQGLQATWMERREEPQLSGGPQPLLVSHTGRRSLARRVAVGR